MVFEFFVWTLVTFATSWGQIFNISDLSEASNFQLNISQIGTRQYFLKTHQCVLHRQTKWHHLAIFRGHSSPVHSGRTVTTLILKRDYDLTMPACHYFINPSQCRSLGDQVSKKYFQTLDACRTFQPHCVWNFNPRLFNHKMFQPQSRGGNVQFFVQFWDIPLKSWEFPRTSNPV